MTRCPLSRRPAAVLLVLALLAAFPASAASAPDAPAPLPAAPAETPNGAEIQLALAKLNVVGGVLYVAAHPDDENTAFLAWASREKLVDAGYLSITRGDGGQNLIGTESGELMGVLRTQELLAARRLDGAKQFFSRAIDFGYSKNPAETFEIWGHEQVLSDVVWVIRSFRPDVIVTRFSPEPGPTHGHHTASVVLAVEAFRLAGDPQAFPEQLRELTPWQPTRIFHNVGLGGAGAGAGGESEATELKIEIGGTDPVSGESFAAIAARSRAMHKTQGFGLDTPAAAGSSKTERFRLLGGEPATHDLLDGVDTTWNRVPGGAEIALLTEATLAGFDPDKPAASVPALLAIRR
ncbi:MAG: PIG-L family deacetylase, partial [Thermoanaerobaculia bacterium]